MGFFAPLLLLGLGAIALPLAAHLMKRRELPTFALPTLALLARSAAKSRRRLEVRDLILLLLRLSIVCAIAFAAARPFLAKTLPYGTGGVAAVVIVVDDSMSMSRTKDGGTLLAAARSRAVDIARSLGKGSEVAVVLAGSPARLLVPRTADLDSAARALASLRDTSARGTDPAGALSLAARALAGTRIRDRRAVLLSDFRGDDPWDTARAGIDAAVDAETLDTGPGNRAIVRLSLSRDPLAPGAASALVETAGATHKDRVELWVDGRPAVAAVSLDASGNRARLSLAAPRPGSVVEARFEKADGLAVDDSRFEFAAAMGQGRVLVVTGDADRTAAPASAKYVLRALSALSSDEQPIEVLTRDPSRVQGEDLLGTDAVFALNLAAPSAELAARLREYVAGGGTLAFAPGKDFDAALASAAWGSLLPAQLASPVDESPPLRFAPPAGASEWAVGGLGDATISRRLLLDSWPPDAEMRATFPDGSPAILERTEGKGRAILVTTSLDDTWSTLPFLPGFLALVDFMRTAEASSSVSDPRSGGGRGARAILAGEPISLTRPPDTLAMVVKDPAGRSHSITDDKPFRATDLPGAYTVELETRRRPLSPEPALAFVVNPDPRESNLAGKVQPPKRDTDAAPTENTTRVPFAEWMLLLAGLLLLLEGAFRVASARPTGAGAQTQVARTSSTTRG